MNSSNSASVSNFEHLSFQINNPFVDPNGEIELAMDVCRSSTSSSDHCFSTASVSIISDCESQELSDLEENDSENVEQVVDNPRDLEEDAIDDLEDENLMDGFSNSSVSSYDEMDYASSSDDGEVVNVPIVEVVEENDHFQYSMDDPTYIVVSSDDGSEVASDLGEELEEATLEDEPVDDRSEVGSETSDHSLENDSAPPPYSTVEHSWVVYDSDSDEDMAEENDVGKLEETTLDEEHNGADQSEISSLESGNDGIVETQLDVVIGNGGILPQLLSYQITHDWLHNFQNHF